VIVPDSARLGEPDQGWSTAVRVLSIERATNRMYRPWRFESELRHLVQACQSDRVLSAHLKESYFQRRVGEVLGQIDNLKGLVERTVDTMMAGQEIGSTGSLTKLYWSECHQAFASFALETSSQVNPSSSPQARRARQAFTAAYLFSRAETIYAGTTEVQLDVIAQRILKLPKELS